MAKIKSDLIKESENKEISQAIHETADGMMEALKPFFISNNKNVILNAVGRIYSHLIAVGVRKFDRESQEEIINKTVEGLKFNTFGRLDDWTKE